MSVGDDDRRQHVARGDLGHRRGARGHPHDLDVVEQLVWCTRPTPTLLFPSVIVLPGGVSSTIADPRLRRGGRDGEADQQARSPPGRRPAAPAAAASGARITRSLASSHLIGGSLRCPGPALSYSAIGLPALLRASPYKATRAQGTPTGTHTSPLLPTTQKRHERPLRSPPPPPSAPAAPSNSSSPSIEHEHALGVARGLGDHMGREHDARARVRQARRRTPTGARAGSDRAPRRARRAGAPADRPASRARR